MDCELLRVHLGGGKEEEEDEGRGDRGEERWEVVAGQGGGEGGNDSCSNFNSVLNPCNEQDGFEISKWTQIQKKVNLIKRELKKSNRQLAIPYLLSPFSSYIPPMQYKADTGP